MNSGLVNNSYDGERSRVEPGGHLGRRPTADPNRFVIPGDQLPPGFAEALDRRDRAAAPPRPASTIVLVRDGERTPEALLLLRHARSGFAADAWVFPGGTLDKADLDPALPVLCDGPSPEEWQATLGVASSSEAFGYIAAAIREAFEETGILIAREGASATPQLRQQTTPPALRQYRSELLAGNLHLRELAVRTGLQLATDQLTYFAHWITPEAEPRRYDTRFFLAPVPSASDYELHEAELVAARWLAPAPAVDAFRAGELKMLPPTVHTLQRLAPFRTVRDMQAQLRGVNVPTILPQMKRHPEGVIIEIEIDA
jgi:8-oxo-dGTP pyrophosphatase MutT (NUDIX family)